MSEPRAIYRTDGDWMATVYAENLFDTQGEWIGWLDGDNVYSLDGEFVGFISKDWRLLRPRVMPFVKRRKPPTERPPFKHPKTVPLPPMFAELSYSLVDVFEVTPDIFALIHELRPDAGEKPLPRLAKIDPRLAVQEKLRKVEQNLLEEMAYGIIFSYGVTEPPVPIEAMAAGLQPEDATNIESASPNERIRLAETMIERLGRSTWAVERGYCDPEGFTPAQIQYAARALLMPRHWLLKTPGQSHQPADLVSCYIVSEESAVLRLHDLK